MKDKKIHIPAKRISGNEQCVIKITREAMDALVEVTNETNLSMRAVASSIILQAVNKELISLDREVVEDEED